MQVQANYQQFIEVLQHALRAEQLVKVVLSKYHGPEAALQRLEMTPVQLKAQWQLKCVYHYQTNHITKNLLPEQALSLIAGLVQNDFRQ
ncbi:MAG: methyltransferase, partial [Paraglaciecola sp.]|nr:methyltransferase [Paraglaciecola sp.]